MILCFAIIIQDISLVISEICQCCTGITDHGYLITTCPGFNHYQSNADIMHFVDLKWFFGVFVLMGYTSHTAHAGPD
jgi:hypothetical protein